MRDRSAGAVPRAVSAEMPGARAGGMAAARAVGGRLSPGFPLGGVSSSACPKSALRLFKEQQPRPEQQVAVPPAGLSPSRGWTCSDAHGEGRTGQRVRPSAAVGLRILRGKTGAQWLQLAPAEEAVQPRGDEMI